MGVNNEPLSKERPQSVNIAKEETVTRKKSVGKMNTARDYTETSRAKSYKNKDSLYEIFTNDPKSITFSGIYSVNGNPTRKLTLKNVKPSEDSITGNPSSREIDSSEPRSINERNPLTGKGLNSADEFDTKKPNRKKAFKITDGNPLLGSGYEPKRISKDGVFASLKAPDGNPLLGIGYDKEKTENLPRSARTQEPFKGKNPLLGTGYEDMRSSPEGNSARLW